MKTSLSHNINLKNWVTFPYVFLDGWYTEEELKKITDYCVSNGTERAKVVNENGGTYESTLRPCNTKFHFNNENLSWFFDKTKKAIENINDEFYQFDLWGFEGFQFTEYAQTNDRYGYHMDMITGDKNPEYLRYTRKLSFILILSDPSEYVGGQFNFSMSEENELVPDQVKGRILVFPSFVMHRVTPVTSGIRRSIVAWVAGPKFK